MADHPFSNAGLGMFGTAEKQFAQAGMQGGKGDGALSKLIGKGIDWLGDQLSEKKSPEGSVPSPEEVNPVMAPKPIAPVSYGFNGSLNMPQSNTAVVPYSQVEPMAAQGATPTDNSQFTVGGYRKFLRPQGFGTPQ